MKKIFLIFGFLLFSQNTFAAVHSVENISEKVKGDRLSLSDVNSILGTIRGFFFDDSTGFVGVGTDSPSAKLHVNGSDHSQLHIGRSEYPNTYLDIWTGTSYPVIDSIGSSIKTLEIRNDNTAQMTIDVDGNVGIGNSSPGAKLEVSNKTGDIGNFLFRANEIRSGDQDGAHHKSFAIAGNGQEIVEIGALSTFVSLEPSLDYFFINTDKTEIAAGTGQYSPDFVIDSSGNVGIGTTDPKAGLHVLTSGSGNSGDGVLIGQDASNGNSKIEIRGSSDGTETPYIDFSNDDTSDYDMRLMLNGDDKLSITGGKVGIGTSSPGAKLEINAQDSSEQVILRRTKVNTQDEGHYSFGADGGGLKFWSGGYANSGGSAEVLFDPNGNITANSVFYESDSRYKKEIQTLPSALEKVSALRGVSYQWKDRNDDSTKIGVVAQEIEKVYPELVHTDEDGYKSVAYSNLVAPMIEAIKELNQTVIELQSQVQHLQNAQN